MRSCDFEQICRYRVASCRYFPNIFCHLTLMANISIKEIHLKHQLYFFYKTGTFFQSVCFNYVKSQRCNKFFLSENVSVEVYVSKGMLIISVSFQNQVKRLLSIVRSLFYKFSILFVRNTDVFNHRIRNCNYCSYVIDSTVSNNYYYFRLYR